MLKAIALLSGGLDSTLAVKLVLKQGIGVEAVNFLTVFCTCTSRSSCRLEAKKVSEELGIPLKVFNVSREYLNIVKHPRHGYGKNMNPCLDCRIFMLRKAGEYMREVGAFFLITGEVLGQRPMSQRREAMRLIEREAGLEGLILRPLSAKLLEPTIPEKRGWIEREKLVNIEGRSRKPQIELAAKFGIKDYPSPAGGCLLTDSQFSARLRDLFQHGQATLNDIHLLKVGRHFRLSPRAKLIVGRDEGENAKLLTLAQAGDLCFRAADFPGPIALARRELTEEEIAAASSLTARYGQGRKEDNLKVDYWKLPEEKIQSIAASPMKEEELERLRI
ncbi:hypothetical protein LR013_01575 [candidate division NPL-UPA2 bacterium]|nr:hypothetical protein [candidate division NPL-UPA2 bacterium]